MNMHGIITPAAQDDGRQTSLVGRAIDWLRVRRTFIVIVVLPMAILTGYYYLVAANQYQSEARFIIRAADEAPVMPSGVGQMLGLAGGMTQAQSEAMSVTDYLDSHDAVAALQKKVDLVVRFRRPEADLVSRLDTPSPTPEKLLKYYRRMVDVQYNRDTGITTVAARAFRGDDALDIIRSMLALGEQRINALNARSFNDSVTVARRQLEETESAVADLQSRMTNFRQTRGDVDPQGSAAAQIGMVSRMTGELSAARAQLATMGATISKSSPQYVSMARQVRSLEAEVATQSSLLAGSGVGSSSTIATDLGGYEDLRLRQEFLAKRYEAAAANLEKAREQARRQQLYLVRVVEPNLPVKSLYPERGRIVLTVLLGLLLTYAIGWLIAAGVREHAA